MPQVLLVDFKYDGNNAAIVEFGCGINSNYSGYAAINDAKGDLLYRRIFEELGKKYSNLIFLSKFPGAVKETLAHSTTLHPGQYTVLVAGKYLGLSHTKFQKPEELVDSINNILDQKPYEKFCIIVPGVDSQECMLFANQLSQCEKLRNNAHIINSHSSIMALAENKFMYMYFDKKKRLRTELINLNNISEEKVKAVSDFSKIVFKPTNSSGALGTMVVGSKDIHQRLELLKYLNSINIYEYGTPVSPVFLSKDG